MSLAYEVLRDPERRARYDRFGPEGVLRPGRAGGTPASTSTAGLGDLFEAFFGSMGGGPGAAGAGARARVPTPR